MPLTHGSAKKEREKEKKGSSYPSISCSEGVSVLSLTRCGAAPLTFMSLLPCPASSHGFIERKEKGGIQGEVVKGGRRPSSSLHPRMQGACQKRRRGRGMVLFIVTVAVEKKKKGGISIPLTPHPLPCSSTTSSLLHPSL